MTTDGELRYYKIAFEGGDVEFNGYYMREMEKPNWHYYRTLNGGIFHFRKEHMLMVFEAEAKDEGEIVPPGGAG